MPDLSVFEWFVVIGLGLILMAVWSLTATVRAASDMMINQLPDKIAEADDRFKEAELRRIDWEHMEPEE